MILGDMDAFWFFMAVIAIGGILLIGYDVYRLIKHLPSISEQTAAVAKHAPIWAWFAGTIGGVLAGHFYWQMC